jgi:hypothetical protein
MATDFVTGGLGCPLKNRARIARPKSFTARIQFAFLVYDWRKKPVESKKTGGHAQLYES